MVRNVVTGIASLFCILVLYPVVSEFFIELAREQGAYKDPSKTAGTVMELISLTVSSTVSSWWFALAFGFVLGGTLFMWVDYILRHWKQGSQKAKPPEQLTLEQIEDLLIHIATAKRSLVASGDEVTHEGFHEAASLSIKLLKLGVPAPFMPQFNEQLLYGSFNEDFLDYLAAITPYIREGDLQTIRVFGKSAVNILYRDKTREFNQAEGTESPPQQGTESETQPKTHPD